MSEYHTIINKGYGEFKEKGSKFISYSFPVINEEDVKRELDELRKQYHDARHHCYAWVLGMEQQRYRANDDGEPSHSAGDPILGQIRSYGLTNTLVVVVRYFGGTKLGVGGLINAYKTAAELALSESGKVQIFEMIDVQLAFDYAQMSVAERLISDFDLVVSKRDFTTSCKIEASIKKDLLMKFKSAIADLYEMNISFRDI